MKTNSSAIPLGTIGSHARQGDTCLRRIKDIPSDLHKVKPVIALGERTGHSHTFSQGGAIAFADDEKALADFVEVTEPKAPLTHQEHDTIVYPQGEWESLKQVEDTGSEVVPVTD